MTLLGILFIFSVGCSRRGEPRVCFKDKCFKVEIADTPQERRQGLMYRKELAVDRGMLFIFDKEDHHGFWMKNTLIPLDIIWLDKNKQVIHIEENVQSCQEDTCPAVYPKQKALSVLELNAGEVQQLGLKTSDRACFTCVGLEH